MLRECFGDVGSMFSMMFGTWTLGVGVGIEDVV